MPSPIKHLLHDIKYTTLDELHENDPGFSIDVVPGSVRHGLVSSKLHIWHLFSLYLEFLCNVVVVLLTLLWIKMRLRLGGCLYAIIGEVLKSFSVDGFSAKFLHTFFMTWSNCCMKIMNIANVICVSFVAIFQKVIAVSAAGLYEFIVN